MNSDMIMNFPDWPHFGARYRTLRDPERMVLWRVVNGERQWAAFGSGRRWSANSSGFPVTPERAAVWLDLALNPTV